MHMHSRNKIKMPDRQKKIGEGGDDRYCCGLNEKSKMP